MDNSLWYEETTERLTRILSTMDQKLSRRLKIDRLLRITARLDGYSADCPECGRLEEDMNRIVLILEEAGTNYPTQRREFTALQQKLIAHLRKGHGLIEEGSYMSLGIAIGLVIGAAFLSRFAGSAGIGVALGVAFGSAMDENAKKQGKVI